jgi:hypothetical protein
MNWRASKEVVGAAWYEHWNLVDKTLNFWRNKFLSVKNYSKLGFPIAPHNELSVKNQNLFSEVVSPFDFEF